MSRLKAYWQLIRMDKPVGTLLLLWPALWGLLLAQPYWPNPFNCLVFILGTFFMRSAGCAMNDFADRKVDGSVERTAARPLPSGLIKPYEAVLLALSLAFISFCLALTLDPLVLYMSPLALVLAFIYPFMKRWIQCPQVFLGAAFGFAIPMGYAAELGQVPGIAWLYYGLTLLWVVGYDTYYALADRKDDLHIGIGSTAIAFGRFAEVAAFGLTLCFIFGFSLLAFSGVLFWLSLFCLSGLAIWQYGLACKGGAANFMNAFRSANLIGFAATMFLAMNQAI